MPKSRGIRYKNVSISFKFKGEILEFNSNNSKALFKDVIDWLYKIGYNFPNERTFTKKEMIEATNKTTYEKRMFHNIGKSGIYIPYNYGVKQLFNQVFRILKRIGVDISSIKTEGLNLKKDKGNVKKYSQFKEDQPPKDRPQQIKKPKTNPFGGHQKGDVRDSALCVLGESGVGKSYTIENILENEGHEYQFIIPTSSTTGLLAQFSPAKSSYRPSRLGMMLNEASENPDKLYTAVFDEFHKPNVIEMINDELLQAISHKRNRFRFVSLDSDTRELYENSNLEIIRGNIKIPDNFGFIFISSKPRIITSNKDFYRRVNVIVLQKEDRDIKTIHQLLGKVLSDEEKNKI